MRWSSLIDLPVQAEIFISQPGCLRAGHDRVSGQTCSKGDLIAFHEIPDFRGVRSLGIEHQVALEMMQRVQRIVQLVVIQQRELVMHVGGLRRSIERRFVKIDRPEVVSLSGFPICFLDPLGISRCDHLVTTRDEQHCRQSSYEITNPRVVSAHSLFNVLTVKCSGAQILFAFAVLSVASISTFADLNVGQNYDLRFVDVDGNALSTADGRFTTLVLTSRSGTDKARTVGDHIPDFCLGNPGYRMITVVVFEKKHTKPTQALLSALIRRRLDSEGHRLQNRYDRMKIALDARRNVLAVADFDGVIARQLGSEPGADLFRVFVFGKTGKLIKQWSDVPAAEDLTAALTEN